MAMLKKLGGSDDGSVFPLERNPCRLGRAKDCDIRDVFRGFSTVSRHHAVIEQRNNRFFVRDTNSHNGTQVNGKPINGPSHLLNGDQLSIGGVEFVFLRELAATPAIPFIIDTESDSTIALTMDVFRRDQRRQGETDAKLRAILDMLATLGDSLDAKEVIDQALRTLLEVFQQANEVFVGLGSLADEKLEPATVLHRQLQEGGSIRLSRTVVEFVAGSKQAVLCADAQGEQEFKEAESIRIQAIRSFMCAPILDPKGDCAGILQINSLDPQRPFAPADLEILVAVTSLIAIAVQYAKVHEAAVQKRILDQDLAIARTIQQNLLPTKCPDVPGYTLGQFYKAAREIGGDYFDHMRLADGRLAVLVADACGKGVAAAVLISLVSGELKSSLAGQMSVSAALERVNIRLLAADCDCRFVTLSMIVIDVDSGRFDVFNAGHFDPLVRRHAGHVESIGAEIRRAPLGIDPSTTYPSCSGQLEPGESLVMFSDGFTDAMASTEEPFGLSRIVKTLETIEHTDATVVVDQIVAEVEAFTGSTPQFDDMCLVCVHRSLS